MPPSISGFMTSLRAKAIAKYVPTSPCNDGADNFPNFIKGCFFKTVHSAVLFVKATFTEALKESTMPKNKG